jgi:uncharacterized protein
MTLLLGALVVWVASFLGGVVGFAYGLVSLPLLLLLGVPLPEVVVINLLVGLTTRLVVVARRHGDINRRRVKLLIIGSIPGIGLGTVLRDFVDADVIKVGAGVLTLLAVAGLLYRQRHSPVGPATESHALLVLIVGGLGGFLGSTTSLNGIAPALLLTGSKATARNLVADLAAFFVLGNVLTLAALVVSGHWASSSLWPMLAAWLPAGLLGNYIGISLGPLLPKLLFRRITFAVILVSGAISTLAAF